MPPGYKTISHNFIKLGHYSRISQAIVVLHEHGAANAVSPCELPEFGS